MPVIDKTKSPGAKTDLIQEEKETEGKKRDVVNALISTLDLPVDTVKKEETEDKEAPDTKKPAKTKEESGKEESGKEEEVEEFESDKSDEEILAADDKDLNDKEKAYKKQLQEVEAEEELIPKSKVEKRFKQLTEKIRELEAAQKSVEKTADDPDMERLEKMTPEKLSTLRQNIRTEIRMGNRAISKGEDVDEKRLDELDVLADKVDEAIRTYPIRFQKMQVAFYNKAAEEVTSGLVGEIPEAEMEKSCVEIKEIAEEIYSNYPKMQQSEDGQALALRLAADHWKAKREFSLGKLETDRLKKSHKRLLRKTTLDNNIINTDKGRRNLADLKSKAGKGGTDQDRTRFVKEDPMFNIDALIPEEFKNK